MCSANTTHKGNPSFSTYFSTGSLNPLFTFPLFFRMSERTVSPRPLSGVGFQHNNIFFFNLFLSNVEEGQ